MIQIPPFFGIFVLYIADMGGPEKWKNDREQKKNLRFGQWFIGKFCPKLNNPSLFYEENDAQACIKLKKMYDDYQWPNC